MDEGPQQQMVSRVSLSMLLLLVSEGLGGMWSKVCVLRERKSRHKSHVIRQTTNLGCKFLHTIGPSSSASRPAHVT
jgi:hypothetical protein